VKRLIRRQLSVFILVGVLTVLVDFAVYRYLISYWDLTIGLSKGCGFFAGTVFAYAANRLWTFSGKSHAPGSLYRFIPLYISTLAINIGTNSVVLSSFDYLVIIEYLAFFLATACSATLNFFGMKYFVFREANN
jgi:putative flippase GtrA